MFRTSSYNDEEEWEAAFQINALLFPHICQRQLGLRIMRNLALVTICQGLTGQHPTILAILPAVRSLTGC